jgi:hypothetical protein
MLNKDDEGVKQWAMSLADPFSGPVRMPSPVPVKTCLYSDKIVNTVVISSAGSFVCLFNPNTANTNTGMLCIYARSAATANESFYQSATWSSHQPGTGLAGNYSTQIYTLGDVPVTYSQQIKVSSAGIRMRYIGSELNRSGVIRACRVYNKQTILTNPLTYTTVAESADSVVFSLGDDVMMSWLPFDISAFNFTSPGEDPTTSSLIIYGSGLPAGAAVEVEVCVNYEYIPLPAFHELLGSNSSYAPSSNSEKNATIIDYATKHLSSGFRGHASDIGAVFGKLVSSLLPSFSGKAFSMLPALL